MRRIPTVPTTAVRLAALVLATVIFVVVVYAIGSTSPRPILDTRSLGPCPPGFDVAAHPEVICYPVD